MVTASARSAALDDVLEERRRQDVKWGEQNHDLEGAKIVEKASGQTGRITADLTANLTYEPGSYECDLGHGYLVVRHCTEIEEVPNTEVEKW
jgi:hypothetical protein